MAKQRASDSVILLAVLMVIAIITIHTCYLVFSSIERLMNELLAPAKDQSTENVVPADGERTALGSWSARNNSNLPELFANGGLLFYGVRPANGRPSFNS